MAVVRTGRGSVPQARTSNGGRFNSLAMTMVQPTRIETVGDDADLQEVYDTDRHLLYVACTRARGNLLITGVEPASEFLDDLRF
jgi:ATP-dependent exoDNAse (exonuclease V) beta subunit